MSSKQSRPPTSSAGGGRAARFSIEFPGNTEVRESIKTKLQLVRNIMGSRNGPTSNTDALENLLDSWLDSNTDSEQNRAVGPSTLRQLPKDLIADETITMVTSTALQQLVAVISLHRSACSGVISVITSYSAYQGFAMKLYVVCSKKCRPYGSKGKVVWNSPRDPAGNFVINMKMLHAYYCTGMLPIQFTRLYSAAGITMAESFLRRTALKKHYLNATLQVSIKQI